MSRESMFIRPKDAHFYTECVLGQIDTKTLNVRALRKMLDHLPDDLPVLFGVHDPLNIGHVDGFTIDGAVLDERALTIMRTDSLEATCRDLRLTEQIDEIGEGKL